MSYNNKKFLDANGVTQIVGLLDDYATNDTLSTVVNSVQTALDQKVSDVQINGSSVLNNGVANIPYASSSTPGLVKNGLGIALEAGTGKLYLDNASEAQIKGGSQSGMAITPVRQHISTFYALAKLAGADMAQSSNAVGTYTDAAKQGIQKLFGFEDILGTYESSTTASRAYTAGETFIFNGKRYRATADIAQNYVITPGTNCELDPIDGHYVKDTDKATTQKRGLVKIDPNFGVALRDPPYEDVLMINRASDEEIKLGNHYRKPIVSVNQHKAVFYGLAKAAGDTTQSQSDNAVGTYTTEAKAAILAMIGAVKDVQLNGTSILQNGVANIPIANCTTGAPGVVGIINYESGLMLNSNNRLSVVTADSAIIKAGTNLMRTLVPSRQHESVFFGLAKAANADLANETVTVGTYPQTAKTAIQTMLGIEASVPLIENVSGTTPTIVGMPNVRYICGEVTLLTITPPAAGSIVVRFSTGSSTTLTAPDTVKWPAWFDATNLDTDTTYEIIITDGVYGGVMSWA